MAILTMKDGSKYNADTGEVVSNSGFAIPKTGDYNNTETFTWSGGNLSASNEQLVGSATVYFYR